MKIGELIKVLQILDPNKEVFVNLLTESQSHYGYDEVDARANQCWIDELGNLYIGETEYTEDKKMKILD